MIKVINYSKCNFEEINSAIAVRDMYQYHVNETGMDNHAFFTKFGIPPKAIIASNESTSIDLDAVPNTAKDEWWAEKRRIKKIRQGG